MDGAGWGYRSALVCVVLLGDVSVSEGCSGSGGLE